MDRVDLTLGVEVIRPDAAAAFQAAAVSATAVLRVLADGGVDSRHVRTADLRLGPRTEYQNNREVLLGYSCGQRLIAGLEGLGALPRLLTDLATTGVEGVRFEGISFGSTDTAQYFARARELAMQDAHTRAADYARLAGRALGPVVAISEVPRGLGGGGPAPAFTRSMAMAPEMPVAAGESDTEVDIQVCFELTDPPS